MNAEKFLILLTTTLFFTMSARYATAEIADSFDIKNLSRSYALSCDEQGTLRRANILPPYFPGRPPEFRNDSGSLVIYSPHLTAEQRRSAQELFASVPDYALPLAWRGGAVYVFTRRSTVEAVPALAVESNWFEDYGLYMEVERRLYLPLEKGEGVKKKPDGTYAARRFVPSRRDLFRVINHETGHMIDSMLGEYSLNARGDDGKNRVSNSPVFLAAIRSDLARLASRDRPISIEKIRKLGYYMPREFDGVRLGIQPEQRARREVFAELWAEAHGHSSNRLSRAYPDTFGLVKAFADFLKAQDAAAPVRCKLKAQEG